MKNVPIVSGLTLLLSALLFAISADAATFVVTNLANDGAGTFRQAILDANGTAEPDTITFNISSPGPHSIALTSELPGVTSPLTIDATTQPGFAGAPIVELRGSQIGMSGLQFISNSNTVRGLVVNGFFGNAISLAGTSSSTRIEGNWIGLNLTGKQLAANGIGVRIASGTNNVIGGTNAAQRNVISGSLSHGIYISASNNFVSGNYIGTDVDGTNGIGNGYSLGNANYAAGVWITGSDARGNVVGGTAPGAGNLISGNARGVILENSARTNFVQGNTIGLSANGSALSSGTYQHGGVIMAQAEGNVIGGTTAAARNIISGNGKAGEGSSGTGVSLNSSIGNVIQGNFIGTDGTGAIARGNLAEGIGLDAASRLNLIGGTVAGARNLISGNGWVGVSLFNARTNTVQGNFIGTKADGQAALGNAAAGVFIFEGNGNTIGGSTAATANVIAYNGSHGVFLSGTTPGVANMIRRNSIFANGGYGIRLFNINCFDCPPINDPGDIDSGPNTLLNTPVITNATTSAGSLALSGTFQSAANTAVTLEFFSNPDIDASGYGEGKTYVGSTAVVTDASGNTSFEVFFVDAGYTGQFITATATDSSRNTSEFSAAVPVDGPGGVIQFAQPGYVFHEPFGSVLIDVTRAAGNGPVSVHYSTVSGTALAGEDYVATSGVLQFADGETFKSFAIPVINDTANEPNETVIVTLDSPTGGAVLGSRTNITLTITDDDPLYLNIADGAVTKPASGSVILTLPVYLSAASTRTVTVDFATANISADAGVDYVATNGSLRFLPGVVTQYVSVSVLADGLQEGAKSFAVNLSNPSEALINDSTGLGTIYDGTQGVLQFSAATYAASESAGFVTITVTRTGGALGNVSVPFAAVAGTATAGTDFIPTNGVLPFNNGVTSRTFSVPLLNDTVTESAETVQLSFGTPTGTTLGSPANATLTITDDELPPSLAIRAVAGSVVLSWSTQSVGFQLMSSPVLPNTNWTAVTNVPVIANTQFVVTNSATSNRFYRLQQ